MLDRLVIRREGQCRTLWNNPYKMLLLTDLRIPTGGNLISIAEELMSIANAITKNTEPEYGAVQARKDLELRIAMAESSLRDGERVKLPLTSLTSYEDRVHKRFEQTHGHDPLRV